VPAGRGGEVVATTQASPKPASRKAAPTGPTTDATKSASLRERKAAAKAKEPIVQVSARASLSIYDRLDDLRTRNRSSVADFPGIAIKQLEAMEQDGRLAAALRDAG
jgi:hypothetical protein